MGSIKLVTNYNDITRRAILYRYSLDNVNNSEDPLIKRIVTNSLQALQNTSELEQSIVTDSFTTISNDLNNYFKNAIYFINFYNNVLSVADKNLKTFNNSIQQFYVANRKDIRETQRLFNLSQIKNRVYNSNSLVKNTFQDALKLHQSFLFDPKTNSALSSKDICNPSDESLTIQEISNYKIRSKYIYIDYSLTSGDIWSNTFDDVYNIFDEGKSFRCILRKIRKDVFLNNEYLSNGATLSLIFDFELKKYFNSIRISEASIKKLTIEENAIQYEDANGDWVSIDFEYDKLKDNYNVFFDTIYTSKIRITFKQFAFVDIEHDISEESYNKSLHQTEENTLSESLYYYYDLSINEISFEYSTYRNKGIYRSNELLSVYKPMSLRFITDVLFSDPDVVIEKYLRVMLFNDKDVVPRILDNLNANLKLSKPTIDEIIPISNETYYEDVLVPTRIYNDHFESVLTFLPDVSSLEYSWEPNQNEVEYKYNSNDDNALDLSNINIYVTKSIKVIVKGTYDFTKKYSIKYKIKDNVRNYLGSSSYLLNGQVKFNDNYTESIGFIQPIIVLRSKSKYNDSTSVISSYKLIVQEKEYTNKKNVTFDIFLAENKGVL